MSTRYPDLPFTQFPNEITNFVTMKDMTVADSSLVARYQEAMNQGDLATAQAYFAQIQDGNQKFLDAEKINKLSDTCTALERMYGEDIEHYLNDKQALWEGNVNRFAYMGIYSNNMQYQVNNIVSFENNGINLLYLCILKPPIGTSPISTAYWRQFTIQGQQGESGTNASFRYAWDSSVQYYLQDVVTSGNSVWGCIQENQNEQPFDGSQYWRKIYSAEQVTYPVSVTPPSDLTAGDLWFEVKE